MAGQRFWRRVYTGPCTGTWRKEGENSTRANQILMLRLACCKGSLSGIADNKSAREVILIAEEVSIVDSHEYKLLP